MLLHHTKRSDVLESKDCSGGKRQQSDILISAIEQVGPTNEVITDNAPVCKANC
jgi:hypothetical protein